MHTTREHRYWAMPYSDYVQAAVRDTLSISFASPVDLFLVEDIQAIHGLGQLLKVTGRRSPFFVYADRDDPNLHRIIFNTKDASKKIFGRTRRRQCREGFSRSRPT